MKAVMYEVPPDLLCERARLGHDRWDEMWEGVLHMNPPPSSGHQGLGVELLLALGPIAKALGLRPWYEVGFYDHPKDYRAPDLAFCRPSDVIELGIAAARLVVEIRSPRDESYEKLDWYVARGVKEIVIAHPTDRRVELYRSVDDEPRQIAPDVDGSLLLESFGGTRLATVTTDEGRASAPPPDGTVTDC